MYKLLIAVAVIFHSLIFAPIPAHAASAEEVIKYIGVFHRYLIDLNKTFGNGSQPETPAPNPGGDDVQPSPDTNEVESN